MPAGRPSKYKPEHCETLIKEMSQGLSYEAAVAIIGVDDSTACRWESKHPDFRNAKKEAFAKNLVFWEKLGIAGTLGKIKNFNATTWIFNMKNRHRWRDKQEVEFSGNNVIQLAYDASKPIEKPKPQILEDQGNGKKTVN